MRYVRRPSIRIKHKLRTTAISVSSCSILLAVAACGGGGSDSKPGGGTITIAYQPGIGSAALVLTSQSKCVENTVQGSNVVFKQFNSGAAIRDAQLSGSVDIGMGGIGPFLTGYDKGIDSKVLMGLGDADLWLNVTDPKYKTLHDFGPGDKIAMPSPNSIQALVLQKAAGEQLGDVHALDKNIASFGHPDGLQALLTNQVAGHLTSPPFNFLEVEKGAHTILHSNKVFGPMSLNVISVRKAFYAKYPKVMAAVKSCVEQSIKTLNEQPKSAAAVLSEQSGGKYTVQEYEKFITDKSIDYTSRVDGLMEVASFMKSAGLVDKVPSSVDEVLYRG